jgi:hypothetical protein
MKTTCKRFVAALVLVLMATILTATASAECGYYPPNHKTHATVSPPILEWGRVQFGLALTRVRGI